MSLSEIGPSHPSLGVGGCVAIFSWHSGGGKCALGGEVNLPHPGFQSQLVSVKERPPRLRSAFLGQGEGRSTAKSLFADSVLAADQEYMIWKADMDAVRFSSNIKEESVYFVLSLCPWQPGSTERRALSLSGVSRVYDKLSAETKTYLPTNEVY